MSTTIVFACKSNSCRSQMAEAWAREWIQAERRGLELEGMGGEDDQHRLRLVAFLDGLMVVSVALDESSVPIADGKSSMDASLPSTDIPLGTSPTSSITTSFETISSARRQCVTCDGELCTSSSSSSPKRRKPPKEKAIQALAKDGVDISSYYAKTFNQILPAVLGHHRQLGIDGYRQQIIDVSLKDWKRHLSFAGLRRVLEMASREMSMAHAGVAREEDDDTNNESIEVAKKTDNQTSSDADGAQIVDNLIVLCSCPDSLKRQLSNMSRETLNWDIDPPSAAARSSEGDGAYLRVSRQIREKINCYMNQLKRCALMADDGDEGVNRWSTELIETSESSHLLQCPLPP